MCFLMNIWITFEQEGEEAGAVTQLNQPGDVLVVVAWVAGEVTLLAVITIESEAMASIHVVEDMIEGFSEIIRLD